MRSLVLFAIVLGASMPLAAQQSSTSAEASTGAEAFAAGTAAFENEDYELALSEFERARDAGTEGPAVHYNIAVSNYKLGRYEAARDEFSLIAERYPSMRELAEYNLGLVALRLGDEAAAQSHFLWAAGNSRDEKIRQLAEAQLGAPAAPSRARWYRMLNVRLGHDDNVRLLSDEFALPDGTSAGSAATELTGFVSGPIAAGRGLRFDGSLYTIRYRDAPFFDQDFMQIGLHYQWDWGDWQAELGPHLSYSTLDGAGYENRAGAEFRLRRTLSARSLFGARLIHDEISAGDGRFSFVEGSRDWLELRLEQRYASGRLAVSYALESSDRSPQIASGRDVVRLRYRHSFDSRWAAELDSQFRRSDYGAADVSRNEDLVELGVGLTRTLSERWALEGRVVTSDNDAPEPYSYTRTRFTLSLTATFF